MKLEERRHSSRTLHEFRPLFRISPVFGQIARLPVGRLNGRLPLIAGKSCCRQRQKANDNESPHS